MKIDSVDAFAIRYPLREPIRDATHDLAVYELAVVRIHTDDGLVGHGFSSATHGGAEVIVGPRRDDARRRSWSAATRSTSAASGTRCSGGRRSWVGPGRTGWRWAPSTSRSGT